MQQEKIIIRYSVFGIHTISRSLALSLKLSYSAVLTFSSNSTLSFLSLPSLDGVATANATAKATATAARLTFQIDKVAVLQKVVNFELFQE